MAYSHSDMFEEMPFRIPAYPTLLRDLHNNNLHMALTQQSKQFWEKGQPGQGYVGLMELPQSTDPDPNLIKIHLIPSFNKDDGLIHTDKNGNEFAIEKKDKQGNIQTVTAHLQSAQPRGTFTGDLHMNAARSLGLGHKGQQNGLLMGFGVWKAGAAIRIIKEDMPFAAIIPNEYILTHNHNKTWTLDYIDSDLQIKRIDIDSIAGLTDSLDKLNQFDIAKLSDEDRKKTSIDQSIQSYHQKNISQSRTVGLEENDIKYAKNRSTSQNLNAVQYDPEYQVLFNAHVHNHQAHTLNLKREIPLPIFDQIIKNTCDELKINQLGDLTKSNAIPSGEDGLQAHLSFHTQWMDNNGFLPSTEKLVATYLDQSKKNALQIQPIFSALWENFTNLYKDNLPTKIAEMTQFNSALPLMLAIGQGDKDKIAKLVVEQSIDPSAPFDIRKVIGNRSDEFKITPIELADRFGNFAVVVELIKLGANPNIHLNNNDTPLVTAVKNNDLTSVNILLAANADPNFVAYKHENDPLPLEIAMKMGQFEMMAVLIKHGANANTDVPYLGTPLSLAVKNGNKEAVKSLIEAGADPNYVFYGRENVIYTAARNDDIEMIKLLLQYDVNVNLYNVGDQQPHHCCQSDEARELILLHGFSKELPDDYPNEAKEVLSQVFLAIMLITNLMDRANEDKFSSAIAGQKCSEWIMKMVEFQPEEDGEMQTVFDPIMKEFRNFLIELNEYVSSTNDLYDKSDVIKTTKAFAKLERAESLLHPKLSFANTQSMWSSATKNKNEDKPDMKPERPTGP